MKERCGVLDSKDLDLGWCSISPGLVEESRSWVSCWCEAVQKLVLLDAQGFIDGAPKLGPLGWLGIKVSMAAECPLNSLVRAHQGLSWLANRSVQVLSSWPLRSMANQMAYYDKDDVANSLPMLDSC
eukprot:71917-Amphidinium_carterae.2